MYCFAIFIHTVYETPMSHRRNTQSSTSPFNILGFSVYGYIFIYIYNPQPSISCPNICYDNSKKQLHGVMINIDGDFVMLCPLLWESRWNIRQTSYHGEPLCLIYNAQRSYAARVYSSEVGKLVLG